MSWVKNGLLLGAGGVIGLVIAAWLESEGKFDDDLFRVPRNEKTNVDGMELLLDKVRDHAKWGMEECIDDTERERVYEQVKKEIERLQHNLDRGGKKIINDLKAQIKENEDVADADPRIKFRSSLEKILKDLENSKPAGESENIIKMELPDGTTRTAVRPS